jgi:hypothetical protein
VYAVTGILILAINLLSGCAYLGRKRIDFSGLEGADKIEIRTSENKPVATILDANKIQHAIRYIRNRQDRWGDRISPSVPIWQLFFYHGERYLGGYGLGHDMIMALPSSHGFWWRDVPASEIEMLLKDLELQGAGPSKG